MAKRGRHTKYTAAMVAKIVKLLRGGCVVADICAQVGINQDTYYDWLKKHADFSEKVDRAKGEANTNAALSLRKAMMPHDVTSRTTKTVSETRLRKARVNIGTKDKPKIAIEEQPYTYTKTEESATLSNEFDWRAALEFLKRRDPDNWGDTLVIKLSPEDRDFLKQNGLEPTDAVRQWIGMMREAANANVAQ